MRVEVLAESFDPWEELRRYQTGELGRHGKYGATAVFVGTMRDFNEDVPVLSMLLEHYPGMTEKFLRGIWREALSRWELVDGLILHRVGELQPNDPIVLVAVWSAHRAAAFDANRFITEALKSRAPFWKQERLEEGTRWVEKNTE